NLEIILGSNFKNAKIDNQDIHKISEFVGLLNVVVFIPDDLYLVKGNPSNRRRFIDLEISKISPIYVFNLSKYSNLLKERNKYLKILNKKNSSGEDRKSTRLNSSHVSISCAVFCLKKKKKRK